ncbi:hypothetical protein [Streptomyces sp. NPDC013187]|uniref:hypothetical protein n=1 Tax=Streptomyces sp. NPDC013187 TaxID=3364865 RepID=UPI003677AD28
MSERPGSSSASGRPGRTRPSPALLPAREGAPASEGVALAAAAGEAARAEGAARGDGADRDEEAVRGDGVERDDGAVRDEAVGRDDGVGGAEGADEAGPGEGVARVPDPAFHASSGFAESAEPVSSSYVRAAP